MTERGGPGRGLERVGEFGPYDLLAEWAHQAYLEGYHLRAVHLSRCALALVDLTGDALTGLYLRYSVCVVLNELGMHRDSVVEARRLLGRVQGDQPYWRAKALAVLAEGVMGEGEMNSAMDALAESSHLLTENPSRHYNQMSASMAVALAMRAMYLFEESDDLFTASLHGSDPHRDLVVLDEATQLLLFWGAMRELAGDGREARELFVRALVRARRMAAYTELVGDSVMAGRVVAYESFVLERLGEPELAERRLLASFTVHELRDELVDGHVARITLARVAAWRGDYAGARRHLEVVVRAAETGREVWATTADSALAEVDELELGRHPGVGRMRDIAQRVLLRLWLDRESRFSAIQSRIKVRELLEETERMGQAVREDPLTGLGNRRRLLEHIAGVQGRVSAFFVDLDKFKAINDTYGHATGDAVLQTIGRVLSTLCRADDVVVRYGGDEFIVIVDADPAVVTSVAHRVHEAVRQMDWGMLAAGLHVTVSIGVATSISVEDVLSYADQALYVAKNRGRDQVATV